MLRAEHRLARNAVWNLLGLGAPLLVAVVAIPPLVRGLGSVRFGLLALSWALIGYSSLFDLGLGRALTRLVAEGSERGLEKDLSVIVWSALVLLAGFGLAGAAILGLAAAPLTSLLRVPPELHSEAVACFLMAAAMIPLVTLTAGLRGILEARRRFAGLSVLRALAGVLTFVAPLVAIHVTPSLPSALAALGVVRLASLAAHVALCAEYRFGLLAERRFAPSVTWPLFQFGGWLTISGLLSPLMVYADRFLIAALVSVADVAFYVTPFEIVTRLLVVPAAMSGALFPELSASARSPEQARRLYQRGVFGILLVLGPATVLLALFAEPALHWWLGPEFARASSRVVRILAAGLLINAAASMPAIWLQASGRPDLTAKLHMIELPLYLAGAVWLIHAFGIEGAAFAWSARVTLDAALLTFLARRRTAAPQTPTWSWNHAGTACDHTQPL
jgi:O-antigen/teichoic acid export membrane protein